MSKQDKERALDKRETLIRKAIAGGAKNDQQIGDGLYLTPGQVAYVRHRGRVLFGPSTGPIFRPGDEKPN